MNDMHWIITLQANTPQGLVTNTADGIFRPGSMSRREAYGAILAEAKRLTGLGGSGSVAILFFSLEPNGLEQEP